MVFNLLFRLTGDFHLAEDLIEGLSVKKISSITGRTENNVKVSLYRARKYLKKKYTGKHR